MDEQPPLRKLSRRTFDWLQNESRQWVEEGVVDEPSRERILSRYDTKSSLHSGTMALTLIAVLMCGLGVLLVIGYNWDRIPPGVKVAMIMASICSAASTSTWTPLPPSYIPRDPAPSCRQRGRWSAPSTGSSKIRVPGPSCTCS